MIPEIQKELEYAQTYSQFVKGLTEEESRTLFGPMLTQDMDAEKTIQTAEAALGQLEYLDRLKLHYLKYPEKLSGEQLQEAINEHGFSGEDGGTSLRPDDASVPLPASELASKEPGGIPWGGCWDGRSLGVSSGGLARRRWIDFALLWRRSL